MLQYRSRGRGIIIMIITILIWSSMSMFGMSYPILYTDMRAISNYGIPCKLLYRDMYIEICRGREGGFVCVGKVADNQTTKWLDRWLYHHHQPQQHQHQPQHQQQHLSTSISKSSLGKAPSIINSIINSSISKSSLSSLWPWVSWGGSTTSYLVILCLMIIYPQLRPQDQQD